MDRRILPRFRSRLGCSAMRILQLQCFKIFSIPSYLLSGATLNLPVRATGALLLARPKSSSLAPLRVNMTLPGLRSRWQTDYGVPRRGRQPSLLQFAASDRLEADSRYSDAYSSSETRATLQDLLQRPATSGDRAANSEARIPQQAETRPRPSRNPQYS